MSMSFAAAALGLVVPTVARAHDAVMPVGTMTSLALSAIGGCWWPLDFEPDWMRALADWLPTTWTMRAYNDLMIRQLPASVALWPFVITAAFGAVVLVAGIATLTRADA
jgi:ABC-2 type transport system permease protein